jgi:hypothetical protein
MTSFQRIALALALCALPGWAAAEGNPCQLADVERLLASGPDGLGGTGRSGDDGLGGTGWGDSDGIGGTGFGEDDGLGGTGIYGTLTRFGSLCVNGLHVLLDDATAYERNGQAVGPNTLALGQVLWVETAGSTGPLHATRVVSDPAVQGRVQSVDPEAKSFVVAGRRVQLDAQTRGPDKLPAVASFVEVSGLEDPHGTIRASWLAHLDAPVRDAVGPDLSRFIEAAEPLDALSIEGFLAASDERDGFRVGNLPILAPGLARLQPDTRVWLSGRLDAAGELVVDRTLFRVGPSRLGPGSGASVDERLPNALPREASGDDRSETDIDDDWIDELLGFGPTAVAVDKDVDAKGDRGTSLDQEMILSNDSKRLSTKSIDSLELEPKDLEFGDSISPKGPSPLPDKGGKLELHR